MSYIIPNNSKSSIILYLDSRDATSYHILLLWSMIQIKINIYMVLRMI
jgi:hypothetical protein